MRRSIASALTAMVLASLARHSTALAQDLAARAIKSNLDLPVDTGLFEVDTPAEEAPEVFSFYSQRYEGDGVFFVIDRSASMQSSCQLEIAKREVARSILGFSHSVQFAVVFFDCGILRFPADGRPARATAAAKTTGLAWVRSIPGGTGSSGRAGLLEALRYATASSARHKVIIYVSGGTETGDGTDEATYLERTLTSIEVRNVEKVQINAVGMPGIGPAQIDFLTRLTDQNGGTFTLVNTGR